MFLNNISENYSNDILEIVLDGFESLMEMKDFESNYKMKMIILEHHSIINENNQLYLEGVKELSLRILEQIKKISDFIRLTFYKAVVKTKGIWSKVKTIGKKGENSKSGMMSQSNLKLFNIISSVSVRLSPQIDEEDITKENITYIDDLEKEYNSLKDSSSDKEGEGLPIDISTIEETMDGIILEFEFQIKKLNKKLSYSRSAIQKGLKEKNDDAINQARLEVEFYNKIVNLNFKLFSKATSIVLSMTPFKSRSNTLNKDAKKL